MDRYFCEMCEAVAFMLWLPYDERDRELFLKSLEDSFESFEKKIGQEMEEFDSMYTVTGTPTTIFIKNGVETSIMSRINGEVSKDKIISKLKQNEYIK